MQRCSSGVAARALAALVLLVAACGGSASSSGSGQTRGAASSPTARAVPAQLPGTIEDFRIYPIKMGFDDQAQTGITFGEGFRQYRANVMFENHSAVAVEVHEGGDAFLVRDSEPSTAAARRLGVALVSSDPYTYSKFVVEQSLPGHYPRSGGYARIIPPGFSDFVPLIFGVAVTAHPAFQFKLTTDSGAVPVPIQPAPSGPQLPAGLVASVGQPLKAGDLTATLNAVGPSGTPTADEAQSSSAMFILADNPMLKSMPWLKASWTITNGGGQNDHAAFSAFLVTSAGILHPEELSSMFNCCTLGPGQSKTLPSFWAMQPAETQGPAYLVLLAVRNDGSSIAAVWKAR